MNLSSKSIRELKGILEKDYGQHLSDEDAQELGVSLLRISRVALGVLARKKDGPAS